MISQLSICDLYKRYNLNKINKKKYISYNHQNVLKLFQFKDFLQDSDVKKIEITNKNIFFYIESLSKKKFIILSPVKNDSRSIPVEIFNFKKFEPSESQILFNIAKKSKNIIDIGANLGWYSINFSQLKNVNSIHSFEPIQETFKLLKRHVKLNDCKKVVLNNIGLLDNEKNIPFFVSNELGSASIKNIQNKKKIKKVLCKISTLDSYIKKKKIKCDLIKVDTEGSELQVFKGAINTIKKNKPVIFTEMLRKWTSKFNHHPNDIINFFNNLDYSCYFVRNKKLKKILKITNFTKETNFFFLHNKKHCEFI